MLTTNPDLVKTGLDLLNFLAIDFVQSWRIGQKLPWTFLHGYEKSVQIPCLTLMARKIAVPQSTAGDTPDTGLDVLSKDGDSVTMRSLISCCLAYHQECQ